MRSAQWCPEHWAIVRAEVEAGTQNGIITTLQLMHRWIARATAEGRLTAAMAEGEKNAVMWDDAPLCCFVGTDVLNACLAEGRKAPPTPLCLKHLIARDVCPCTGFGPT
jgi:hypothetical protein